MAEIDIKYIMSQINSHKCCAGRLQWGIGSTSWDELVKREEKVMLGLKAGGREELIWRKQGQDIAGTEKLLPRP